MMTYPPPGSRIPPDDGAGGFLDFLIALIGIVAWVLMVYQVQK